MVLIQTSCLIFCHAPIRRIFEYSEMQLWELDSPISGILGSFQRVELWLGGRAYGIVVPVFLESVVFSNS